MKLSCPTNLRQSRTCRTLRPSWIGRAVTAKLCGVSSWGARQARDIRTVRQAEVRRGPDEVHDLR